MRIHSFLVFGLLATAAAIACAGNSDCVEQTADDRSGTYEVTEADGVELPENGRITVTGDTVLVEYSDDGTDYRVTYRIEDS